ncbi:hypothetical protein GF359_04455 [candidate division WOR-3 bacterium]|uniref:DNA-directed DNA polymerase n=1 Tax=candidate division WOR-3 bacterium TaxID=2052148 RepID=A0A9D5K8T7_UNCW3|nr:hypothetical protein [candidate division WOR-3 bacterium]MBD3364448.1 hypothetical protein [candidate division WOR-3 bacterium]
MRITREELLKQISEGTLERSILCHGEEGFFHDMVISALREKYGGSGSWGFEVVDAPMLDPAKLFTSAGTLSFGGGTKVTLIRNAHRLYEAQKSGLEKLFSNPTPERLIVLSTHRHLKQANELLAWCKDNKLNICVLNPIKSRELVPWIKEESSKRNFSLDKKTIAFIIDLTVGNLQAINQMLDKIDLFRTDKKLIGQKEVEDLLNDTFEKKIYDCVKAVFEVRSGKVPHSKLDQVARERNKAASEMQRVLLFDSKDGMVKLIKAIFREAFNLLKYHELKKAGASKEEIAKILRLRPSQKWLLDNQFPSTAARWPADRLHNLLMRLAETDFSLRVSGRDAEAMLEQIVIGNLKPTSIEEYDEVFL